MANWRTVLPSANVLLIFEAAARCLSFSRAAEQLGISQPAVSHAVKQLEQRLGVRLFERQHRGVGLTAAGQQFYQDVATGLEHIYRAAYELKQAHNTSRVTLSVSTAFATHWLLPRVARFKQLYPAIELRCLTTDTDTELQQEGVDLRIPLGGGDWLRYDHWYFTDEAVVVVGSPEYLQRTGDLQQPADLLHKTLLHLEADYPQRLDWNSWLQHYGVMLPRGSRQFTFNDYSIVIQAALEGQGLALGWLHIIGPLLAEGRLLQALPQVLITDNPFYILAPSNSPLSPAAQCLRDWLITEIKTANNARCQ